MLNIIDLIAPRNPEVKIERSELLPRVWLFRLPLSLPDEHLLLSRRVVNFESSGIIGIIYLLLLLLILYQLFLLLKYFKLLFIARLVRVNFQFSLIELFSHGR
jgi:hypothetical protein